MPARLTIISDSSISVWRSAALGIRDFGNFQRGEETAFRSGTALANLLKTLSYTYGGEHGGKISMFAHSMGNMVAGQALRELAQQNAGKIVDTYVMTQAAMGADAYMGDPNSHYPAGFDGYLGGTNPYFRHIDDAAKKIVNFYNPSDRALNLWEIGNGFKPDLHQAVPVADPTIQYSLPGFNYDYGYEWNGVGWIRVNQSTGARATMSFATNPFEMFSYMAHDLRPPVGRDSNVGGPISVSKKLGDVFAIGNDHSGQWDTNVMRTQDYWRELMTQFSLTPT